MLRRKPQPEPERYTIDEEVADPLADEIRDQFISQRKALFPLAHPPAKSHYRYFMQAAERCRSAGMTAGEYVKLVISSAIRKGVPLYPQAILTVVDQESTEASLGVINTYKSMLATFDEVVSIYGPRMILADPRAHLSPLIRCVLAKRYGFTDLVRLNAPQARAEFETLSQSVQALFAEDKKYIYGL